jgi:ABC-type transporter Mla subunit MlaD
MRRIALIVGVLAVVALLAAVAFGSSAQGGSDSRFDVVFDDARGLIAGQLVKVAGAKAGTIQDVKVVREGNAFRARIEGTIESKFMPFHQDARCTIRPEGLIAENYVDCDPGTPASPTLQGTDGHPPTVPVERTTEPVSLLNLFNIFNLPTRERFQVLIDELGIGTAGRGADFNAIIRRANPALQLADQVTAILARQNAQLAQAIDATSAIAAEGAGHTQALQTFLDQAAALASITAAHSSNLNQAIARLPGLLAVLQPSLQQLDTVARDGTPLLSQLRAAVPSLNRVNGDFPAFVKAAKPGLATLGRAITAAIPAVRHTTPLTAALRTYLDKSLHSTQLFARLASNLQRHGFSENFLQVAYEIAAALAQEDATSHMLSALLVGPQNGMCAAYALTPVTGCSAHYGAQPTFTPSAAARVPQSIPAAPRPVHRTKPTASSPASAPATPAAAPAAPASSRPRGGGGAGLPALASSALQQTTQTLKNLVNYLLR